jgi:hypothetical protein
MQTDPRQQMRSTFTIAIKPTLSGSARHSTPESHSLVNDAGETTVITNSNLTDQSTRT